MPFEMKWTERSKKQIPPNSVVWVWNKSTEAVSVIDREGDKLPASFTHWQLVTRVKPYGPAGKPKKPGTVWLQEMADECELRWINAQRALIGEAPLAEYGSFFQEETEE